MQPESLISAIESVADPGLAEDWDRSGVQVAATRRAVRRLAVALDPTPSTIARAIEWEADFILTHHPVSLNPSLPCRLDDYHAVLRLVLSRDIWLYSAHTSLDVQTHGPVSWLARSMRLSDIAPIAKLDDNSAARESQSPAGFGVQGTCHAPMSWSE